MSSTSLQMAARTTSVQIGSLMLMHKMQKCVQSIQKNRCADTAAVIYSISSNDVTDNAISKLQQPNGFGWVIWAWSSHL